MTFTRTMIAVIAAMVGAGAYGQWVRASEPPPPAAPSRDGRPPGPDRKPDMNHPRREWTRESARPVLPVMEPMSDAEYDQIVQFMKTNSPRRWEKLQEVMPDRRDNIVRFIRQQYRWMQKLKEEDPQVYDIRMKRLPIEDEMFNLGWELRHGESNSPDEVRQKLREQVRLFLDNSLAERRVRLERWRDRLRQGQQAVQREEVRLAEAEANRESMIDKGYEHVINDRIGMLKQWAGPMFGPGQRENLDAPDDAPTTAPVLDQ